MVEHLELDKVAQAMEITKLKRRVKKLEKGNKVKILKLRRLQKVGTRQRVETSDKTVMDDVSNQGRMIAEMDQDADVVLKDDKEVVDAVKDVHDEENAQDQGRTAESQAEIYKIDLDHANKEKDKRVVIRNPEESSPSIIIHAETKSKDKDEAIDHVKKMAKEDPAVKKYQVLKREPQTESQARKNMIVYLKNVVGFKMDYFKGISYDDIRPIFEAKFNTNVAFLQKTREEIKEEESIVLRMINEILVERAVKRKKLDEEVEELKRHLQIVPNEDDDVYTEATPPAQTVLVIDYQIIELNNKPYYKIIRADDTHQLYVSFLSLLRNFNREDLEALWSLVKERFSTSNPNNFSDDFLLVTLRAMIEKPDIHAEESKKCTWSSKGQRMEAIGIMWCADHNFYNYPADFVSGEGVLTHKIHSRPDAECCKT
nr:hypothetical protein [Tanacetum cinerariifolium]